MINWLLASVVGVVLLVVIYLEFIGKEEIERFEVDTGKRHFDYELNDFKAEYFLPMENTRILAYRKLKQDGTEFRVALQEQHRYPDSGDSWLLRPAPNVDPEQLATAAELLQTNPKQLVVLQINLEQLKFAVTFQTLEVQLPIPGLMTTWMVANISAAKDYREVVFSSEQPELSDQFQLKIRFTDYELMGRLVFPEGRYRILTLNDLVLLAPDIVANN